MPRRDVRKSKVEGLYKQCRHLDWDRCSCPWWGRHKRQRVSLEKWTGQTIPNKEIARAALRRLQAAVDGGTFDRRGERPTPAGLTFGAFLDDYEARHAEGEGLRSNSVSAYLGVFRDRFGEQRLSDLARRVDVWEDWLRDQQRELGWSNANYNRYFEHVRAMFNWAMRRGLVAENPFLRMSPKPTSNTRERRISEEQERKLFECCALLDRAPDVGRKLTREIVGQVRRRAAEGELQKVIALSLGISPGVISNIVTGAIWNPHRESSLGAEMRRRLIGALDVGLRKGEMLRVQVKHVDYAEWIVRLPAEVTKAGKDQVTYAGTDRVREVFKAQRFLGPDAYVFGREDGTFVASFEKTWKKLFRLAGLPVGRKGYVWHDLRHEYGSSLIDQGATVQEAKEMMRHVDIRTTQRYLKAHEARLRELAGKLGKRA